MITTLPMSHRREIMEMIHWAVMAERIADHIEDAKRNHSNLPKGEGKCCEDQLL